MRHFIFLLGIGLILAGCSELTGSDKIEVMKPCQFRGTPIQNKVGAKKDVEINIVSWSIDVKYNKVEKHYLAYFKEKGFETFKNGAGYLFRNETTEVILLPQSIGARAELRIAEITNDKPMPKGGLMAKGQKIDP